MAQEAQRVLTRHDPVLGHHSLPGSLDRRSGCYRRRGHLDHQGPVLTLWPYMLQGAKRRLCRRHL
jgi:hypothetical protein